MSDVLLLPEVTRVLGLELDPKDLRLSHILLRATIVFFYVLLLLRIAKRRFLAQRSPLDVLLSFLLASMVSRSINGSAPFFETLAGGLLLVLLHRLLTWSCFHSELVSRFVKGHPIQLVEDGTPIPDALAGHRITQADLDEDMRTTAGIEDLQRVKHAYLERDGCVSVAKRERVVELPVRDGVQTIRLEIG